MNIDVKKVKIIVTAPLENAEEIRTVLGDAGTGIIGNYSYCSMTTDCMGMFKGNESSNPYIGTKNLLETVKEAKIEVQCDIENVKHALQKIRAVHPYEEPCIEIYPLIDESVFMN